MATVNHAERLSGPRRWPTIEEVEENLRQARRVATTARHAAEDAVSAATLQIRRHPVQAVGASVAAGLAAGALVGFVAGWVGRGRCDRTGAEAEDLFC